MTVVNEAAIRKDIKQWSGLVPHRRLALASVALIVVQVAIYLCGPLRNNPWPL